MKINVNISLNKVIQLLLLFLFVLNMSEGLFMPLFAVFVTEAIRGATLSTVGFTAAIYAITKSIFQIPIARRIDKQIGEKDDFYVMLIGSLASMIYVLGLVFIHSIWQLYLLQILSGIGGACLMAAYYAVFSRHVDKGSEGVEWSLFSVWGLTISVAVGGAIGGVVTDAIGFRNMFSISAAMIGLATLVLVFLYPLLDGWKKKAGLKIPIP